MNRPPFAQAFPVILDDADIAAAKRGAMRWQWEAEREGNRENPRFLSSTAIQSRDEALAVAIEGAVGEVALAKLFGIPWRPNVGGDRRRPDVGHCDARTTRHLGGRLLLKPDDEMNRPHCLIVGTAPLLWFVGWIYGRDAMLPRFWRPERRSYWFPQAELLPWPVPPERFHYERKEAA